MLIRALVQDTLAPSVSQDMQNNIVYLPVNKITWFLQKVLFKTPKNEIIIISAQFWA